MIKNPKIGYKQWKIQKYCSINCYFRYLKIYPRILSTETKTKMSETWKYLHRIKKYPNVGFKKGNKPVFTEERCKKISEIKKEYYKTNNVWNKGLTIDDARVKKYYRKNRPEHSKWMKENINLIHTPEAHKKLKILWQNPEYKEKQSIERKQRWQSPEYREKTIKAILKGLFKRPTFLEQQMIDIIQKHNLPYKYVGDGSFLIGYKNPDFVNVNGEKICIEVRNPHISKVFHKQSLEQYEKERIEHFAKYGWKCIIFQTDKLDEKEVLATMLRLI